MKLKRTNKLLALLPVGAVAALAAPADGGA